MIKKHVLSGATSGIGRSLYDRLKEAEHEVIPVVRNKAGADLLGASKFILADFESPDEVRASFKSFDEPVDYFINCAGVAVGKPIWDTSNDENRSLININLLSPVAALSELRGNFRDGGGIFLFSSISAYRGGWDDIYIASKAGISGLVKSLSAKMAPNVRVIGIAPGVTAETRMTNERKIDDIDKVVSQIPMATLASPNDIAEVVISLMGPAGAHITGAMIDINGGAYLR